MKTITSVFLMALLLSVAVATVAYDNSDATINIGPDMGKRGCGGSFGSWDVESSQPPMTYGQYLWCSWPSVF